MLRIAGVALVPYDLNQVVAIKCSKNRGLVLPGGKVEKDETAKQGAIRELNEEANLNVLGIPTFLHTCIILDNNPVFATSVFAAHIFLMNVVSFDHLSGSDEGEAIIVTWDELISNSLYASEYDILRDVYQRSIT